jgi:hypothetical protein
VSQSWGGNTASGTNALNNALGVGVVELASYLTLKAGSLVAKGGKMAVNAAKSTFKAGVNLAKRAGQMIIKGAKWILEKGKLIFKGLDNTLVEPRKLHAVWAMTFSSGATTQWLIIS